MTDRELVEKTLQEKTQRLNDVTSILSVFDNEAYVRQSKRNIKEEKRRLLGHITKLDESIKNYKASLSKIKGQNKAALHKEKDKLLREIPTLRKQLEVLDQIDLESKEEQRLEKALEECRKKNAYTHRCRQYLLDHSVPITPMVSQDIVKTAHCHALDQLLRAGGPYDVFLNIPPEDYEDCGSNDYCRWTYGEERCADGEVRDRQIPNAGLDSDDEDCQGHECKWKISVDDLMNKFTLDSKDPPGKAVAIWYDKDHDTIKEDYLFFPLQSVHS